MNNNVVKTLLFIAVCVFVVGLMVFTMTKPASSGGGGMPSNYMVEDAFGDGVIAVDISKLTKVQFETRKTKVLKDIRDIEAKKVKKDIKVARQEIRDWADTLKYCLNQVSYSGAWPMPIDEANLIIENCN